MFDALGYVMQAFIFLLITIIGAIPNAFMGGLTICILATALTYFTKKSG